MRVLMICEVGLTALPFLLTQFLMTSSSSESEKELIRINLWKATGLNLLLNLAALMVVNRVFFHIWRFWRIPMRLLRMTASYQEVGRMGMMIFVLAMLSILIAMGLRQYILLRRRMLSAEEIPLSRGRKAGTVLIMVFCGMIAIIGEDTAYHSEQLLKIEEVFRKTQYVFLELSDASLFGDPNGDLVAVRIKNDGILENVQESVWLSEADDRFPGIPVSEVSIPAGGSAWIVLDYDLGPDLDKEGGSILCLRGQNGLPADSVQLPALVENQSYRRTGDTWNVVQPGVARMQSADISVPVFSRESGFYDGEFDLSLEAEEGVTIHYTLDCSEPSADSPVYDQPIRIYNRSEEPNRFRSIRNVRLDYMNLRQPGKTPEPKAFVVRAAAMDAAGNISKTVTKVYFISQEMFQNSQVVSLTADPEDLFGAKDGIYVTGEEYDAWYETHLEEARDLPRNKADLYASFWAEEPKPNFQKRGRYWERAADLTFLEQGKVLLDQRVGIRIQGGSSRLLTLKRFAIYARNMYSGSRLFDQPLFRGKKAHSVFFRPGVLNALSQRLGEDRDVLTTPYRTVDVFINGEFWYRTFLYEEINKTTIANTFGVMEENVVIAKNNGFPIAQEGESNSYEAMYAFPETNDLSTEEAYLRFCRIIDVQSYIDAYCFHIYLANADHRELSNNLKWHTRTRENDSYGDSRWRWGLYDMDLIWNGMKNVAAHNYEIDPFTMKKTRDGEVWLLSDWYLFNELRKNATFRQQYAITFMDLVNTCFQADHVLAILEELENEDESIREFFLRRKEYAVPYLAEAFGLSGEMGIVTLESSDPEAGTVTLNTIHPDLSDGAWNGEYFTDYPVTVTAEAAPGYEFSCWMVNGIEKQEETAEITFGADGVCIRAVFNRKQTQE